MGGVSGSRAGQATIDRPIELNELDGDMTASDVIEILRKLHFATGFTTIQIDRDARDFLVASIAARCGKA
jgi:hypothetical protein